MEEVLENEIKSDLDKSYATEREDEKTDNEILLEEVASRIQNMSED